VVLQDDEHQRAFPYAARGQTRCDAPRSLQRFPEGHLDGIVRGGAALFFIVSGAWSLVGGGLWAVDWVAWKATLFGVIIAFGLWIRVAARR